jgi:nucleoside-diphosphate-sugar epimerase
MAQPLHVVVTGATGFVGGYLARWLAGQGYQVTGITRQAPPQAETAALTWRRADLTASDSLPPRFDALIHCAAEIPARCPDPDLLYTRNMDASRAVFHQAIAGGARSIIFLSSMSAFGAISVPVVTEAVPPDQPDPYGRAKLDTERLLKDLVGKSLYSGLSIRLPGTVGKGSHNNFLSDAAARVIAGETVTAKNPESLFNNIVYVGDLAVFVDEWLGAPRPGHAMTMLAAEQPLSLARVISLLFECAAAPEKIRFEEGGKKPFLIALDQARALGYRPATVEASIRDMMRDCLKLA